MSLQKIIVLMCLDFEQFKFGKGTQSEVCHGVGTSTRLPNPDFHIIDIADLNK